MIVVDASVLFELIIKSPRASKLTARIGADGLTLHAPDLVVLEVAHVLRKALSHRKLSETRAQAAFDALRTLSLRHYAHTKLLNRIWALRHNLSAYDAAYVALAESLDAPLVTLDERIARAPGHKARVELLA